MSGTLLHRTIPGTLELTQGALNIDFENRFPGNFPPGVDSRLVITDSSKGVIAEWDGDIHGHLINYTVPGEQTRLIPVGAQYSFFVTWSDGEEYQWEHGYVARLESQWPSALARQPENQPLSFSYVPSSAVGNRWQKRGGTGALKSWDNSLFGLPHGLGVDNAFFVSAAAVWDTPLATNSVKGMARTLNAGPGKSAVTLCSDDNMTSYLGIQFETGVFTNRIHIVHGTGPVTMTDLVDPVNNTVANGDTYPYIFDEASKTLSVYKGSSLDPIIEWTDENNLIPLGQGYTYCGVNFIASLLNPGTEFSYLAMKDN